MPRKNKEREAADAFAADRHTPVLRPFAQLLRSRELTLTADAMRRYRRHSSALTPRIGERVILITARERSQQVEWSIHQPIAQKSGVDPAAIAAIAAIAEGRRPEDMPDGSDRLSPAIT